MNHAARTAARLAAVCLSSMLISHNRIAALPAADKLTLEAVVAKHLESIGDARAREVWKSSRASGTGIFQALSGADARDRKLQGPSFLKSEGRKFRSSMEFGAADYPAEGVSCDGREVQIAQLEPGKRSALGSFLFTHDEIVREGLFGGTLSTAWPLLNLKDRRPGLKYLGIKDQGGRRLHELRYTMNKGGSDLDIRIYLEDETFRHVATAYLWSQSRVPVLDENFNEFRKVDSLTVPFQWRVRFVQGGVVGESLPVTEVSPEGWDRVVGFSRHLTLSRQILQWEYLFDTVELNREIDPKSFRIF